jgi:ATP-dependent DNA ligase
MTPLRQPFAPMEALSVDAIPVGEAWRYEPKWDGFRCLAFRDGAKIELQSKSGRSMHHGSDQTEESKADGAARLMGCANGRPQAGARPRPIYSQFMRFHL